MKGRVGHGGAIYNYTCGVGSLSSIYTAYIKVKKISGSRTQSASPAYIKAKKTSGSWAQSVSASKESRRFRRNQKWFERQRRSSTITLEKSPHVIEFLQVETLFNHFYLVMELQDGDASELALLDEFTQARGLFDVGDNIGRPLLGARLLRSNNP
ncbi:unnamed protein product [Fusarium graminearum]|uniref:Uncharacterized protein n=1 Tax=Gibberella zeae TaxID=5518 RepID=A0A8H3PPL3_GIBZA|nr:unnamed protein product [Fusarium graminearum]CAG1964380.1 unnamed protein product [Fusarium graminearum]CAG1969478.1 unnamed protein product [Fusarium graminearum]